MKKILSKKGFLLSEALVVATVLLTALVIIYAQYAKILIKLRGTRNYNTDKAMYAAYQIGEFMSDRVVLDEVINCINPASGTMSKNLATCTLSNGNVTLLLNELEISEVQVVLNNYNYNQLTLYNDPDYLDWSNYLKYLEKKLSPEEKGKANDLLILTKTTNGMYGYNLLIGGGARIVDVLVVGGGGAGAPNLSGGGGGGGVVARNNFLLKPFENIAVTIGAGGTLSGPVASNGQPSSFGSYITAYGGGKAQQRDTPLDVAGGGPLVGSGGGAASYSGGIIVSGGISTSGQGYNGGKGHGIDMTYGSDSAGGGGGGAGDNGTAGNHRQGGNGGIGKESDISGVNKYYGGGGGGGSYYNPGLGGAGGGGRGDGGAGTPESASGGTVGVANTGGGGGGCFCNGGSGVVIVRYVTGLMKATGGVVTTSGVYTIHTFNTSGNFVVVN